MPVDLSFDELPPPGDVIVQIGERTTTVIHDHGLEMVRIGFSHFVNDVAHAFKTTPDAAYDIIAGQRVAHELLDRVLEARGVELGQFLARAFAEADLTPQGIEVSSRFSLPKNLLPTLEDALGVPCRLGPQAS